MQKSIYTMVVAMLLTFSFAACANSGDMAEENDKAEVKKTGDPVVDSLAAKRYPIRNEENQFVTLETNFGNLTLELWHDVAPAHADSFAARTVDGFYSGTIFHRVVDKFMIQGGNGQLVGKPSVGYNLTDEFNDLPHQDGTLSMASTGRPNSASTQFFICLSRRGAASLDGKYTNFGQLIKGYDVLHAIGKTPVKASSVMGGEVSEPLEQINLIKAYLSDADGKPLKEE